jgi:hypothetical protein
MPRLPKKRSDEIQWNEIDELREEQLFAAVRKKQDEEDQASTGLNTTCRWYERFEDSMPQWWLSKREDQES